MNSYQFITGSEAVVLGALEGGAEAMFGYPITPSTEILQGWINKAVTNKKLKYLQTEDETSAGFAVIGALLAGIKAFTATAGPGTILMQDPLSMAENQRLPFVAFIMQRGGPSTGTVNYSQQEVNLAAFGGNGDGLRIVYSASTVEELYQLSAKVFSIAWKYRFPTILLGDGHLAKMQTKAKILPQLRPILPSPILKEAKIPTYLRNCFSSEEDFYEQRLKSNIEDWNRHKIGLAESEVYMVSDAKDIVIAHGSVAQTAKEAISVLRKGKNKVGLFRPITINPFDFSKLKPILRKANRAIVLESSLNQLSRIVKYESYGLKTEIIELTKPALPYTSNEIINLLSRI